MSKIMRELYAEARKTAANATERRVNTEEIAAPNATGSPPSSIDWWRAQYESAGRAATFKAAEDAKEHQARHSETAMPNRPWIVDWVSNARRG